MWRRFCFKPSKTRDIYEDEIALYRIIEDEQLAKGIQESLNAQEESSPPRQGQQEKQEEARVVEIPLPYDEDAHVAEAVKVSLKEEGERKQREKDEQVKNDEKIAKDLQNMVESPPRRASLDVVDDEEFNKAVEESLKEEDKRKQFEKEQVKNDEQIAKELQNVYSEIAYNESSGMRDNNSVSSEQFTKTYEMSLKEKGKGKEFEENNNISTKDSLDEQRVIWESFRDKAKGKQSIDEMEEDEKLTEVIPPRSICGGCDSEIEYGKSVDVLGVPWHPECLWCDACHKPISIHEVENRFREMETEERTRMHNESVLEDEKLAKTIERSLEEKVKQKVFEEQTKKDEQIAQEMVYVESIREHDESVFEYDEDEQLTKAVEKILKEKGKGKQFEDVEIAQGLENFLSKMAFEESTRLHDESVLEDEQFAKAVEKSLMEKGKGKQNKDEVEEDEKLPEVMNPPPPSICGGCKFEVERERSVDILGVLWHPECLQCDACDKEIAIHEVENENHVSNTRGKFHKSCYDRYCYICKEKKMKRYNEHHFWKERYCPTHDIDGTPKCCSCERFEPRGTNYVLLDDGRWLCLECMDSAVMDSHECQPLHFEIREYFEGLNMKIEKEFPFLLVLKDALNKAEKEEKIDNQNQVVTRGICLSEAQTVMSISKATRTGPNIDTEKEPQRVVRDCEVTAILILYGLPRLLTGYILAHEMMHAYLRLNGHRKLNEVHEEGICQVLGHMWLESQRYAAIDDIAASSSSQTPLPVATSASSKKGDQSEFEKRFVEFCLNQIETDESRVYGDGFRKVNKMVTNSSLQETLKEIIRRG